MTTSPSSSSLSVHSQRLRLRFMRRVDGEWLRSRGWRIGLGDRRVWEVDDGSWGSGVSSRTVTGLSTSDGFSVSLVEDSSSSSEELRST